MTENLSVGIISYNEEENIGNLLNDIMRQDYPLERVELIFADGLSSDRTLEIIQNFAEEYKSRFLNILVLANPKRIQPAGWNVVFRNFTTDFVIRLDAHARIPENFISENMRCMAEGENVVGGRRINIVAQDKAWQNCLLAAETSMFGSGMAKYRTAEKKEYVKSLAHGCYRREVVEKTGLFDERFLRSEDNEYHARIWENGYRICLDPKIRSEYITRPTWKGMCKQKYGNGFWVGATTRVLGMGIFSWYHFIPFLFLLGILSTVVVALCGMILPSMAIFFCIPAIAMWGCYGLLLAMIAFMDFIKRKSLNSFLLPLLILTLHLSYGIGTLFGLLKGIGKEAQC